LIQFYGIIAIECLNLQKGSIFNRLGAANWSHVHTPVRVIVGHENKNNFSCSFMGLVAIIISYYADSSTAAGMKFHERYQHPGASLLTPVIFCKPAGDVQQFVHILGPAAAGMPPAMSWEAPTEKEDISFLTFP
jgi:hypothetical protein